MSKITFNTYVVKQALTAMKPLLKTKIDNIQKALKLEVSNGQAKVSCFNFEALALCRFNVNTMETIEPTLIPFDSFFTAVTNSGETFTLSFEEEKVKFKAINFSLKINTYQPTEYCDAPPEFYDENISTDTKIELNKEVSSWLTKAASMASSDITKGILTCVKIDKESIVSTDSYRLFYVDFNYQLTDTPVLIPAEFIKSLPLATQTGESYLYFKDEESNVIGYQGSTYDMDIFYSSRILSGSYPNTYNLIPDKSTDKVIFDIPSMINQLKLQRSLYEKSHVTLLIDKEGIELTFEGQELEGNFKVEVEDFAREEYSITLSSQFLEQACTLVNQRSACLTLHGNGLSPILIEEVGDSYHYRILIMPIRLT